MKGKWLPVRTFHLLFELLGFQNEIGIFQATLPMAGVRPPRASSTSGSDTWVEWVASWT
jgi:hypothetical protein